MKRPMFLGSSLAAMASLFISGRAQVARSSEPPPVSEPAGKRGRRRRQTSKHSPLPNWDKREKRRRHVEACLAQRETTVQTPLGTLKGDAALRVLWERKVAERRARAARRAG